MSVQKNKFTTASGGQKDLKVLKVLKMTNDFNIKTCSAEEKQRKAQQAVTTLELHNTKSTTKLSPKSIASLSKKTTNTKEAVGRGLTTSPSERTDDVSLSTSKEDNNLRSANEDGLWNRSDSLPSPTSPLPELETQALSLCELDPSGKDIEKVMPCKSEGETKTGKLSTTPKKRKKTETKLIGRPSKSKKPRITRDQQYDINLSITCEIVKKCIRQVNDKLDKNKFKGLCRKVSKQMVFMWISKNQRTKNYEKWLNNRHLKIVRLIERYLKLNKV
jgi:hypothetical protein